MNHELSFMLIASQEWVYNCFFAVICLILFIVNHSQGYQRFCQKGQFIVALIVYMMSFLMPWNIFPLKTIQEEASCFHDFFCFPCAFSCPLSTFSQICELSFWSPSDTLLASYYWDDNFNGLWMEVLPVNTFCCWWGYIYFWNMMVNGIKFSSLKYPNHVNNNLQ